MTPNVEIVLGQPDQRAALANLVQLYIHDFTDFLGPERGIDVGADGRFADLIGLERYWTELDRSVWFIQADGAMAGFALLNTLTHSGQRADFNMAEFFVTRPYRGRDVAARAAVELLNLHPGQWEVAVLARNAPGQRFWPRVITGARSSSVQTSRKGAEPGRTLVRFVVS